MCSSIEVLFVCCHELLVRRSHFDGWATDKFDGRANAHPWLCLCTTSPMNTVSTGLLMIINVHYHKLTITVRVNLKYSKTRISTVLCAIDGLGSQ